MVVDTGNFHAFFPGGCYRKTISGRREEIISALDDLIQKEKFDLSSFDVARKHYIAFCHAEESEESFSKLNEQIVPLFLLMVKQGFSEKELRNYEAVV